MRRGSRGALARTVRSASSGGVDPTARTVTVVASLASTAIRAAAAGATAIAGTPAYMAPEVLRGEAATEASDQFGFGVAAYEALAGERPFDGGSWAELLRATEAGRVPALRDVPAWLDAAVRRCLAPEPARR
ncbi:MAG: protein kinase, partial [Deltaproteobacteria bacterium]|nr:protein kinase [Deltaproteobacteria bacterium]